MEFDYHVFENSYAAIIAAVFGGVGVRLLDKVLSRRSENFSEASTIRKELRDEVEGLRETMIALREEADSWRSKYWEEIEEGVKRVAEISHLKTTIAELQETVAELQVTIKILQNQIDTNTDSH